MLPASRTGQSTMLRYQRKAVNVPRLISPASTRRAEQTRNGVELLSLAAAIEAEPRRVGEDGRLLALLIELVGRGLTKAKARFYQSLEIFADLYLRRQQRALCSQLDSLVVGFGNRGTELDADAAGADQTQNGGFSDIDVPTED